MAPVETLEYPAVEVPARIEEQVRSPRLSEALRYGQMNVGQAFGQFVDDEGNMCALSTVWHGMGYDVSYRMGIGEMVLNHPEWGFLLERVETKPILAGVCGENPVRRCHYGRETLGDVLMHFNDDHRMPRNEIADRLSAFGL